MGLSLRVDVEEIENNVILRVAGRLDAASAPSFERKLEQMEGRSLLLDFAQVDYLSSAGLRVLLAFSQKAKAGGENFILFSLSDAATDVIKMAGFNRVLTICSTEKAALQMRK